MSDIAVVPGQTSASDEDVAVQLGPLTELEQVLGQLAVVPGVHCSEGLGTHQPLDLAHHVERLRGMRTRRDAEAACVRVKLEQNPDRRQRRQVGPDLVHLLDRVQRMAV